jgi:hypothetical protein
MWQPTFRAVAYGMFLALIVIGSACGSPKSKRANGDGDGTSDAGASTKLDALPGGYEPRIACGDLGKTCSFPKDCAKPYVCTGGLCLPSVDKTGSCEAGCPGRYPICLTGTCVSADQLGCMCLDEGARKDLLECESVSDAPSDRCLTRNALCDTKPDGCCEGLSCLQGKSAEGEQLLGLCEQPCTDNDECPDGCCLENAGVAGKFCAPASACQKECRAQKEECDGEFLACCEGLVCVTSEPDPELRGCQLRCEKHTQCDSGCCVLFTASDGSKLDFGICAPQNRCDAPVPP